jgi:hypothetical protein
VYGLRHRAFLKNGDERNSWQTYLLPLEIRNTKSSGSHVFVVYHLADGGEWIVDNEIPEPKQVPQEATPWQPVFLLSSDRSAPVDVELHAGLNRLSFF